MQECPYKTRTKCDDACQGALYIVSCYTVTGCSTFPRLSRRGWHTFSIKGQRVNISGFAGHAVSPPVVVHKQPLSIHKQTGCLDLAAVSLSTLFQTFRDRRDLRTYLMGVSQNGLRNCNLKILEADIPWFLDQLCKIS